MSLIDFNEGIKQSIEAASDGMQTALVTPKGQLTYMTKINKFNVNAIDASLGNVTHPAFIVNGVEKPYILVGTYQSVLKNGELVSQPNQPMQTTDIGSVAAISPIVKAMGTGYHLMTLAEWGAVRLLAAKENPTKPVLGNTYYGRSAVDATQYGRRTDGLDATAGITTGNTTILTGSGTVRFRHNQKYNGISDLVGNGYETLSGIRFASGEIQILVNNSANIELATQYTDTASWKALDGSTGAFVAPGSTNTVKIVSGIDYPAGTTYPAYSLRHSSSVAGIENLSQQPVSDAALQVLRQYGFLVLSGATGSTSGMGTLVLNSTYKSATLYLVSGSARSDAASGIYSMTAETWSASSIQTARICYYPA